MMLSRALSPKSTRSVAVTAEQGANAFPESHARIHNDVSAAAETYEEFRVKLQLLIASLKTQHALMLKTSEKRLQTAKQFEALLADTPLAKIVSEVGSTPEAKTKLFAAHSPPPVSPKVTNPADERQLSDSGSEDGDKYETSENEQEEEEEEEEGSIAAATERTRENGPPPVEEQDEVDLAARGNSSTDPHEEDSVASDTNEDPNGSLQEEEAKDELDEDSPKPKPNAETDEEMASRLAMEWQDDAEGWKGPSKESNDDDEAIIIKPCATDVTAATEESAEPESPNNEIKHPVHNDKEEAEANPRRELFQPLVFDGSGFDEVHRSYGAVHEASHKLSALYSEQYSANIVRYIEEWDKAASDRIHGRLLEFDRLKLNLEHYVRKVHGLRTGIQKTETRRHRQVKPKASQRFDRNELKLGGAREAYDSYGESLLLLLEEVTHRAWRDCFPLLRRVMLFDVNLSSDRAKIFAALNETVEMLEEMGAAREVDPHGRIRALREMKPEEIYTGGKHVIPPVHSTRDVYEV